MCPMKRPAFDLLLALVLSSAVIPALDKAFRSSIGSHLVNFSQDTVVISLKVLTLSLMVPSLPPVSESSKKEKTQTTPEGRLFFSNCFPEPKQKPTQFTQHKICSSQVYSCCLYPQSCVNVTTLILEHSRHLTMKSFTSHFSPLPSLITF